VSSGDDKCPDADGKHLHLIFNVRNCFVSKVFLFNSDTDDERIATPARAGTDGQQKLNSGTSSWYKKINLSNDRRACIH